MQSSPSPQSPEKRQPPVCGVGTGSCVNPTARNALSRFSFARAARSFASAARSAARSSRARSSGVRVFVHAPFFKILSQTDPVQSSPSATVPGETAAPGLWCRPRFSACFSDPALFRCFCATLIRFFCFSFFSCSADSDHAASKVFRIYLFVWQKHGIRSRRFQERLLK